VLNNQHTVILWRKAQFFAKLITRHDIEALLQVRQLAYLHVW